MLPPFRGIEYQIDLVHGESLPNKPAYRTNPKETKEIKSQVQELLEKGCDIAIVKRSNYHYLTITTSILPS